MTVAIALDDGAIRRTGDRRLSIAIGVSLLVHAVTIASLRGLLPTVYSYAQGGAGSFTALQAVLAGPKSEPAPAEQTEREPAIDPGLLLPPGAQPVESPIQRPPPQTAPAPGGGPVTTGPNSPDVSVAVGLIDDPARLGPDYVARLAQRFPERVSKTPLLLGSPIVMYPAAAMAAGAERRIAALLTLDADGRIVDSQLVPDDPMFGPVVQDALKNAQFTPAEIDMRTVPYWAILEFVFTLERPSAPAPRRTGRASASIARQPNVGR
ncbi:MAG TPA: energy transducer TonB [Casimicrobiaceae bacterium]|nr:energy transducer TonB [Casimicrobiaceae bacterium]